MPLTKIEAKKIALSLKGASEGLYFNKPSVFYDGSFLTRVHDKEEAMVLTIGSMEMRDMMLEAEPGLFYITDHYKPWPMLLARLKALDKKTLKELLAARVLRLAEKSARKRPKKPVKDPRKKKAAG